jgi:hypothetical protein
MWSMPKTSLHKVRERALLLTLSFKCPRCRAPIRAISTDGCWVGLLGALHSAWMESKVLLMCTNRHLTIEEHEVCALAEALSPVSE